MNPRSKKVEKVLNVDKEERRVAEIVLFCDGELPRDQTHGTYEGKKWGSNARGSSSQSWTPI
jgi:hypothetical protein